MGKTIALVIFVSIVLLIYGLGNYYIWVRAGQALQLAPSLKPWLKGFLLAIILAYPVTRFVSSPNPHSVVEIIHLAGVLWLGAMLYIVLILGFFDFSRWLLHLFGATSAVSIHAWGTLKLTLLVVTSLTVITLLAFGYFNAREPVIRELSLEYPPGYNVQDTRVVLVSDIHMGRIIGKKRVAHLVELINAAHPDLVILAGDLVDDEMDPVISTDLGEPLEWINAPLGVFAVTGNHEYIGDSEPAIRYLEEKNIRFLRDESILLPVGLCLIGREDRDRERFTGLPRLSLDRLMEGACQEAPIILIDHQPYELEEKASAGVFLTVSGHTHHGQLWPLQFLTKSIFSLSRGYRDIRGMHAYVSTGFGSWGPPVRIGNRPEIVIINLVNEKSKTH